MSKKNDDTWVCNWCGSEEIFELCYIPMNHSGYENSIPILNMHTVIFPKHEEYISECSCGGYEFPMKQFDWEEKIAVETMGNKEEYHKILDGSRV